MPTNIILIGMMGSGKTTVGRLLAQRTGLDFIDLDEKIEEYDGRPIKDIFAADGEDRFREIETEVLKQAAALAHAVIATGGGIVMRHENRKLLKEMGKVFWLDAPADVLLSRIGDDETRPMLRGGDPLKRLQHLHVTRREYYAETSDIHLDTTDLTTEEIVEEILKDAEEQVGALEGLFATIVAIDGPVGAGKSSFARHLAARLGFTHIDTGAMYRCVALEALRRGVAMDSEEQLVKIAHAIDIRFSDVEPAAARKARPRTVPAAGALPPLRRVTLNGEDVTEAIRSPEVSKATTAVADKAMVRAELVRLQRELALRGHTVLEGRDIATVVVPEAEWKIYLVASLDERVDRRREQYEKQSADHALETLREDVIRRDERDRSRAEGALRLSPDATIIDNTGMDLNETVEMVALLIEPSVLTADQPPAKAPARRKETVPAAAGAKPRRTRKASAP